MITQPSQTQTALLVELPASLGNFFDERGYIPSNLFENRSNARLKVRCETSLTILTWPAFVQRHQTHLKILVKDLSKKGIGILCHQQMYPLETFAVELLGRSLQATVVRCRKLGDRCYEVGARLRIAEDED
jgi:hypothetical protein